MQTTLFQFYGDGELSIKTHGFSLQAHPATDYFHAVQNAARYQRILPLTGQLTTTITPFFTTLLDACGLTFHFGEVTFHCWLESREPFAVMYLELHSPFFTQAVQLQLPFGHKKLAFFYTWSDCELKFQWQPTLENKLETLQTFQLPHPILVTPTITFFTASPQGSGFRCNFDQTKFT